MTPTARAPIRIVIADDSYLIREALTKLLDGDPRIEVAAVCENRIFLERAIAAEHPAVVLTDIRMPPTGSEEGIEVAERLRESSPETGVIVLGQYAEPHYAFALLSLGSERRGYLLKERLYDRSELVRAIETVAAGGTVIDPKVVELLIAHKAKLASSPLTELTPGEREVLALVAEGKSNTAIAEELFLTKRGVEKHINVILTKLGLPESVNVSRRVRAAIIFLSDSALALAAPSTLVPTQWSRLAPAATLAIPNPVPEITRAGPRRTTPSGAPARPSTGCTTSRPKKHKTPTGSSRR